MMGNKLPLILVVVLFAGCVNMTPEYKRPAAPIPAEWPARGAMAKTGEDSQEGPAATDLGWRSFYDDEKLRKVIGLALDNNRDLRVAALNIEKAGASYRIQRAELLPAVKGSGTLTRQRVPADLSDRGEAYTSSEYSLDVGISSWELDFFGRIRSLKDKVLDEYLATEQAAHSTRLALVAEVATAYLTLAADRECLRLAQSTLESRKATFALVQGRFQAGISSDLDLRQAQTGVESARSTVTNSSRLVALDINRLNLLVGTSVPSELLPDVLGGILLQEDLSPGLTSEVLLMRPDILQAEYLLKAANANIGAARAAFFPRISLTSSLGTTSDQLSHLFKAGSHTWAFAPQISLPIFEGGALLAGLEAAKIDRDIYVAQYEKAIQTAFREVADALSERANLGDQVEALESLVRAWQDAYRLSEARYLKGVDNYLTFLDAQRSLYAAQQELVTVRLSRLANLVTLYKVLGGGAQ